MHEPIRLEGYVVRQEMAGSTVRFFSTKEEAEAAAIKMLSGSIPTLVIPAVKFTTGDAQNRRGEPLKG
jgi:hypothetical protein